MNEYKVIDIAEAWPPRLRAASSTQAQSEIEPRTAIATPAIASFDDESWLPPTETGVFPRDFSVPLRIERGGSDADIL